MRCCKVGVVILRTVDSFRQGRLPNIPVWIPDKHLKLNMSKTDCLGFLHSPNYTPSLSPLPRFSYFSLDHCPSHLVQQQILPVLPSKYIQNLTPSHHLGLSHNYLSPELA